MKNEIRMQREIDRDRNHGRQMQAITQHLKKEINEMVRSHQPVGWITVVSHSSVMLHPKEQSIPCVKVTSQPLVIYHDTGTRKNPKSEVLKFKTVEALQSKLEEIMKEYQFLQ